MIEMLFVLTIAVMGILVWLLLEHNKLKRSFQALEDFVERNNKDIASLCSAAVAVDGHMLGNDELLKAIAEKLTQYEEQDHQLGSSQPYESAIQKIQTGATAEELVMEYGMSLDEAMLLIRLHSRE